MVHTRFHHPVPKDKILTGDNLQYERSMDSVSEFKKFILSSYEELENYSDEELLAVGIKRGDNNRNGGHYEIRTDSALFHLGIWRYAMGMHVNATQWGVLDTPVGRLTGGAISASMRSLDFEATDMAVGRQTSEHQFSFSFEDTGIDRKPVGTYIEACLPHPDTKIEYDEEKGQYKVNYKERDERPKEILDGSAYVDYCNQDGTPFKSEPFVSTTYENFDSAIEDIKSKTSAFQNVWNSALTALRENKKQETSTIGRSK